MKHYDDEHVFTYVRVDTVYGVADILARGHNDREG